jgi:large subunit ribosomal protein L10
MNRKEKTDYVNSLKETLNENAAMMIYLYQGLNVNQLDELRKNMREAGALLKVTKNRITKIALKGYST